MATRDSTTKSATMDAGDQFPFTQLPGEIRNQIYREVIHTYERGRPFTMSKTSDKHTQVKRSPAWALTQVSRQLRFELLPLVLPERKPRVALDDLVEYLEVFYGPAVSRSTSKKEQSGQQSMMLVRQGQIKLCTPRKALQGRLLASSVDLLPVLYGLEKYQNVTVHFQSYHIWGMHSCQLAILHALHKSWEHWRNDIATLGLLDLHFKTEYRNIFGAKRDSTLTMQCKGTTHSSEKKRVLDLCSFVYKTGLRNLQIQSSRFMLCFITPKTKRAQSSEVKLTVGSSLVKLEWASRGSYTVARLVDDNTNLGFKVERKRVEGKDVLRL